MPLAKPIELACQSRPRTGCRQRFVSRKLPCQGISPPLMIPLRTLWVLLPYAFLVALLLLLMSTRTARPQGFVNLNFEAANVNGTRPGAMVPIAAGLPGWSGSYSNATWTSSATQVAYDGISLGGSIISIIDSNSGVNPIQGQYGALLFGGLGGPSLAPTYSTISQVGLVPIGSRSLLMDVRGGNFTVTIGGRDVGTVPLQAFPTFTLYGADISAFAGLIAQLSITVLPTGTLNEVLYDNISFSNQPIPEPNALGLLVLGALILLCGGHRRSKLRARIRLQAF
jgi:hypothetical protein